MSGPHDRSSSSAPGWPGWPRPGPGRGGADVVVSRPATASAAAPRAAPPPTAPRSSSAASGSARPRTACTSWSRELGLETFPTWNDGRARGRSSAAGPSRMGSQRGAVPKLNPFALADLAPGPGPLHRAARRIPLDRAVAGRPGPRPRRPDLRDVDPTQPAHATRPGLLPDRHRGGVLGRVHRPVGAARALLRPLRHRPRDAAVGGPGRPAGPHRRRLDPHQRGHGRRARRPGPPGVAGPAHRARRPRGPGRRRAATADEPCWRPTASIVTLPPTLAGRLDYAPALPSWRDQLTQRLPAGSVIKLYAIYDEPFWRADGLTGQAASDEGPVKVTFDNSPPSGTARRADGLHGGQRRPRLGPSQPRRAARRGRRPASSATSAPRPLHPVEYLERDWMAEEFSRGCYGAHFTPGVWTAYGDALRDPGRAHPLGRGRVLRRVERLHGGRRPLRRVHRRRRAGPARLIGSRGGDGRGGRPRSQPGMKDTSCVPAAQSNRVPGRTDPSGADVSATRNSTEDEVGVHSTTP